MLQASAPTTQSLPTSHQNVQPKRRPPRSHPRTPHSTPTTAPPPGPTFLSSSPSSPDKPTYSPILPHLPHNPSLPSYSFPSLPTSHLPFYPPLSIKIAPPPPQTPFPTSSHHITSHQIPTSYAKTRKRTPTVFVAQISVWFEWDMSFMGDRGGRMGEGGGVVSFEWRVRWWRV